MQPQLDFDHLQLRFRDPIQRRYEIIRPLVLFQDRTATQRAEETQTHPETVGTLKRRFEQQGILGLLPDYVQIVPTGRRGRVPDAVVQELEHLKGLYDGFQYRELCRIIFYKLDYRISDKTVKKLWHQLPPASPQQLPLLDYHSCPERSQARQQVIELFFQGWSKTSISRFLRVSRPTINEWIGRFESDNLASLEDNSSAPKAPVRKAWLPVMLEVYHLQKRHPDAGRFRIWSVLGNTEISVRTVGRVMALNKRVYTDIPHVRPKTARKDPQPHPYKAQCPHEYWFIDGRMMDFEIDGVRWWSLIVLDGYSRTMLAGAVAPSEASWVALMVLYTACLRYGAPQHLISDKGGAYISNEFEAVCVRLGIDHKKITSTEGESYLNLMETHFNIQRRLYDYQFSLTRTPLEFEQAHQDFIQLYNTTAHQGLLEEQFASPIPLDVLGEAKGRLYTPEELERKFARALFPRTTNRYGCVTLHSYHFYVEAGLPKTQVLLWVYGTELRAVFDNVVLAEYHCRYNLRHRQVKDIQDGHFYATRFASPQGTLIPLNPQESLVLYRPRPLIRQARLPFPAQQLWLFERVETA
ncbi:MAG: helix-turn-helix domain-containing protein [Candidatus Tectomicrobia bacterium]